MPRLTIAPDMSAEAGLGASGWALGSQTCKGTAPAFDPNPTRASRNAVLRTAAGRCTAWIRIAAKVWLPAWAESITRAKRIADAPAWVITAYHSIGSGARRDRD